MPLPGGIVNELRPASLNVEFQLVAFYPNPAGSVSEMRFLHSEKHKLTLVAFYPNPAGSVSEVRFLQL